MAQNARAPEPVPAMDARPLPGPARHGAMAGSRTIEKAKDPRGALRRLADYLKPYIPRLIAVLALVVAAASADLLGPYLLGVAIDRFINKGNIPGLARITLLMLGVYLGSWFMHMGYSYIMVGVSKRSLRDMRRALFGHLQRMSLGFFDRRTEGELMSRFTNDIDAIDRVLSQSVTDLIANLLSVGGIAIVMLTLNVWLALGAMTLMPLIIWLTTTVGKGTRKGFRQVQVQLGTLNAFMEENITGARVVQAFNRQEGAIEAFQKANLAVRDTGIRAQSLAMILPPVIIVLSNLDITIVAGLGAFLAVQGMVSVGLVATFIMYARRFFRPLMSLGDLYNSIQSALAGAERVFQVLDQVPELPDAPDAVDLPRIEGRVQFEGVHFSYVPGVPVLTDVTLEAAPGQTIALVGPTGAGKTTIVNLLSRFYDVNAGAILLDGHDIRTIRQDSLRRQLGIVLQDTFLFADTVLENIRYGRLGATDEECIAAARLADADQFIRRLPEGYKTVLSERASNLSQGQRQLLAIARAVLSDPRILVLDEATSSVDTRTEIQIQAALLKLMQGRTSFVIAHRLSTIRKADMVLVINGGRIIERGTHESLLAAQGFYYNLYMSQFKRGQPVKQEVAATMEPATPMNSIGGA
jgi:ATP-binding cassette, subfamily B, multidrug efflux pump